MFWTDRIRAFWRGAGGGREVLAVAYPLILSQMSFTVQVFVDRLFLTWYGPEAVAGAVTGLFTTWSIIALFIGTGEYLTTFVAQYLGAGRPRRIGPAIWQGVYFSILAGLVVAALEPLSGPVFRAAGHPPDVAQAEATYSSILMMGAFPVVLMATLSTFFAGRGETRVVLLVNVVTTLVDTVLNYLWIFGHAGFPRAGVAGAAWSTIVAQGLGAVIYIVLILRPAPRRDHATLSGWRLEPALLKRLLRFGLPTGLQYSLEVLAFGLFMLIVGRLGTTALAASSIAFNLNMIVFMPMLGLGVGVSSVVGRHLGADRPREAERATWSAFWMSLGYFGVCGAVYVLAPWLLITPYAAGADPSSFAEVGRLTAILLRFVALYSIFDMMNVVFSAGLKGAGDTTYPLVTTLALGWTAMLVPAWLVVTRGGGLLLAWAAPTLYVVLLGLLMMRRFRTGRWREMRVIEPTPVDLEPATVAHDYAPFYCEENVLRLAPSLGAEALAVLATNGRRSVAMRDQRAGVGGAGEVVWDYHAFAISRGDEWLAWDFDTTLGWPLPARDYLCRSFVPREGEEAPLFRVMTAVEYARVFRSDRSHMRREDGSWMAPPPPWPAADATGGVRLSELLDPGHRGPGEVLTLAALIERLAPRSTPTAAGAR